MGIKIAFGLLGKAVLVISIGVIGFSFLWSIGVRLVLEHLGPLSVWIGLLSVVAGFWLLISTGGYLKECRRQLRNSASADTGD